MNAPAAVAALQDAKPDRMDGVKAVWIVLHYGPDVLTSVVVDEDCAYSTQKQVLNALAHFFKYVLGVKEPVFGVKLRNTGTRIPVVRAKRVTHVLFDEIRKQEKKARSAEEEGQEKTCRRYELAARL